MVPPLLPLLPLGPEPGVPGVVGVSSPWSKVPDESWSSSVRMKASPAVSFMPHSYVRK